MRLANCFYSYTRQIMIWRQMIFCLFNQIQSSSSNYNLCNSPSFKLPHLNVDLGRTSLRCRGLFSLEYNRQHVISEGSLYNIEHIPRLHLLLTTIYKHFDLPQNFLLIVLLIVNDAIICFIYKNRLLHPCFVIHQSLKALDLLKI